MKTFVSTLVCWYRAHNGYSYWRVEYADEPRFTRLLSKSEAKGLAECFEGKAWIDYKNCRR